MAEKRVRIQRGFVLGFLAVGVVTVASGVIMAVSGQTITANVASNAPTGFTESKCPNGCAAYYKKDDLSDSDLKAFFPSGVTKSYIYIPASCGSTSEYRNRLIINATNAANPQATVLKAGDKVNFSVLVQNTLSKQISYKKFLPRLTITNGNSTLTTLNFSTGVDYLNIKPNATWKKTLPYVLPVNLNVANMKVDFVTYWGSGAYCGPSIPNAIPLTASPSTSPTPTPTATSISRHIVKIKGGYNTITIPESWGKVKVNDNQAGLVTVFDYNWLGDHAWRPANGQNVTYLTPGMGYYVYCIQTLDLIFEPYNVAGGSGAIAKPGWTLLSNSTGRSLSIANDQISVLKSGAVATCLTNDGSQCYESKTIKEMIQSSKAYNVLYVVTRDDTSDPNQVFDLKTVDSSNIDSITIPQGKNYWLYTGNNKWYE